MPTGALLSSLLLLSSPRVADLQPGQFLPDVSKIPLLPVATEYRPQNWGVSSLEQMMLNDGVVIVHFTSPRPARRGAFETTFLDQLADLQKATLSVPYPCKAVAIVPFGEKGREDTNLVLNPDAVKVWGDPTVYYEPTYPRPGLYRTFRPDAQGAEGVMTPYTYIIGPDRKIIAARGPESSAKLYDWLQQSLPASVTPVPKSPSTNLSLPALNPWTWPAFRRSSQRQPGAPTVPDVLPYTYLAWQTGIGRTFASPVVSDGTVYISTDNQGLQSVALMTGQRLLAFPIGASWWSSPVVADNTVFAVSAQGTVFALDRGNFSLRWKAELGGLVTSSPVVSDGALFVGARNGNVYALDAANGAELWHFQTGGEISSSPALSGGVLVIGSGDRSIYALDAKTGGLKWSLPTDGPVDSSPSIAGEDVIVGSFDGALYSVRLGDGHLNWKTELGGWVHSSPVVSEDTIFAATVNVRKDVPPGFFWIDRKSGKKLGNFDMPDAVYSSPTVWGDLVLVGCRSYDLFAFDRKMKQTTPVWSFRTRSYLHASPVVVGDTVLLASFDGNLYALRQAKPIRVWGDNDIVPRWFVAAMTRELHQQVADLVKRAAAGKVGAELTLRKFGDVFGDVKSIASASQPAPKVLPRDVPPNHPGAPFVEYVLTAGLLSGYPDGTYRPDEPSTRYQFALGLSTVLEAVTRPEYTWRTLGQQTGAGAQVEVRVQPPAAVPRTMARDVPGNHWALEALTSLAQKGLLILDDENNFRGNRIVTLKDVAQQWDRLVSTVKVVRIR